MIAPGAHVRIPSIERTGRITYINYPDLYVHHAHPIQVTLDTPWARPEMMCVVTAYRTNTRDCEIIEEELISGGSA